MVDFGAFSTKEVVLLALLMSGGGGYIGYEYVYQPRAVTIAAMEARLETLRMENETASGLTEQDGESAVHARLARYTEQLVDVERLIPSAEELPDLLDAISAEAQRTGVELSLIQPAGEIGDAYYTRRTYSLGVLGSYHQIGSFLTGVASLPRIITPSALNVSVVDDDTRTGDPLLEARFAIETYVLPMNDESDESGT